MRVTAQGLRNFFSVVQMKRFHIFVRAQNQIPRMRMRRITPRNASNFLDRLSKRFRGTSDRNNSIHFFAAPCLDYNVPLRDLVKPKNLPRCSHFLIVLRTIPDHRLQNSSTRAWVRLVKSCCRLPQTVRLRTMGKRFHLVRSLLHRLR